MNAPPAVLIRTIREGLGLSQEDLAAHLGVQSRTVHRWETGATQMRPTTATKLAVLESRAAELVADHVARHNAGISTTPAVFSIDTSPGAWPPRWQRAIAFRIRQQIPTLVIIEPDPLPEES